jgi:hypothetical protein
MKMIKIANATTTTIIRFILASSNESGGDMLGDIEGTAVVP